MNYHRERSVHVAQAILNGSIDVVEGSRELAALRHDVEMSDDDDFLVFVAIGSEADGWPEAAIRSRFSPTYLEKTDIEKRLYLEEMHQRVQDACIGVLSKMSV